MLMPIVLFFCYKRLIKFPPTGSIVIEAIRAVKTLFRDGNGRNAFKRGNSFWDNARPSAIAARGGDLSESRICFTQGFFRTDSIMQVESPGTTSSLPT
jgi:POT family proton-dependent oligopeptide transporter